MIDPAPADHATRVGVQDHARKRTLPQPDVGMSAAELMTPVNAMCEPGSDTPCARVESVVTMNFRFRTQSRLSSRKIR